MLTTGDHYMTTPDDDRYTGPVTFGTVKTGLHWRVHALFLLTYLLSGAD